MKHLTAIYNKDRSKRIAYALNISVPLGKRAQAVSNALAIELGDTVNKKSKFVCDCIVSGVMEPVYQSRVKHALDILDSANDLDELEIVREIKMALTGCQVNTETTFTGELSSEYLARYSNE